MHFCLRKDPVRSPWNHHSRHTPFCQGFRHVSQCRGSAGGGSGRADAPGLQRGPAAVRAGLRPTDSARRAPGLACLPSARVRCPQPSPGQTGRRAPSAPALGPASRSTQFCWGSVAGNTKRGFSRSLHSGAWGEDHFWAMQIQHVLLRTTEPTLWGRWLCLCRPSWRAPLAAQTCWPCGATWDARGPTGMWSWDRAVTLPWSLCAACTDQKQRPADRTFWAPAPRILARCFPAQMLCGSDQRSSTVPLARSSVWVGSLSPGTASPRSRTCAGEARSTRQLREGRSHSPAALRLSSRAASPSRQCRWLFT